VDEPAMLGDPDRGRRHTPNIAPAVPNGNELDGRQAIDDLTIESAAVLESSQLQLYGLSAGLTRFVNGLLNQVSETYGHAAALTLARAFGRRHASTGYRMFLTANHMNSGPEAMRKYQDLAHSLRGPRHATALFAKLEGKCVIVCRTDCVYFGRERGQSDDMIEALEQGMLEGYLDVDPAMRVENLKCLSKGNSDGCEHRFIFS
jgi:hypothetical protein